MINKKQIIIDGVDVRKCVNRRWDNSQKMHLCYDSDTPFTSWGWCENNPNCYYKQLQRKTQEYELLVRTNKIHIDTLNQLNNKYINLEQECEELKNEYWKLKQDNDFFSRKE